MNNEKKIKVGDVVQLNEKSINRYDKGSLLIVTEVKSWGVQGYVHSIVTPEGDYYYRPKYESFNYIGKYLLKKEEKSDE